MCLQVCIETAAFHTITILLAILQFLSNFYMLKLLHRSKIKQNCYKYQAGLRVTVKWRLNFPSSTKDILNKNVSIIIIENMYIVRKVF